MAFRWIGGMVVAVTLVTAARAASTVELINRWEPGETARTRLTIENDRTVSPLGMMPKDDRDEQKGKPKKDPRGRESSKRQSPDDCPMAMPFDTGTRSQKLVCEFDEAVTAVDHAGTAEVEMRCRSVKAEADLGDSEVFKFDSTKAPRGPAGRSPRQQALANFVGQSIRLKVGKDGAIRDVQGLRPLVEAMAALQDESALGPALLEQLGRAGRAEGKDGFDELFSLGVRFLPAGPVRRGDSWTTEVEHTLPIVGVMRTQWVSTLARLAKKGSSQLATITSVATVRGTRASGDLGTTGLPAGADIEVMPGTGEAEILFDVTRGRTIKATMTMDQNVAVRIGTPGIGQVGGIMQSLTCRMVHEVVEDPGRR